MRCEEWASAGLEGCQKGSEGLEDEVLDVRPRCGQEELYMLVPCLRFGLGEVVFFQPVGEREERAARAVQRTSSGHT